jgi:hypothetical protein
MRTIPTASAAPKVSRSPPTTRSFLLALAFDNDLSAFFFRIASPIQSKRRTPANSTRLFSRPTARSPTNKKGPSQWNGPPVKKIKVALCGNLFAHASNKPRHDRHTTNRKESQYRQSFFIDVFL